jgi:hypothetical protein
LIAASSGKQRLRRWPIFWIWIAVIALVGVIAHGEFVRDWRVQRSGQTARFTMAVSYSLSLVDYNKLLADMKQSYGERAATNMDLETGIIQVILDGKVIETRAENKSFSAVYGIFVIGPDDAVKMRFPFVLATNQNPANLERSVVLRFKGQFKRVPQQWLEFSDNDWTIDRCTSLPAGLGLGVVGEALRLREGTSCVVTWKGSPHSSMLVSVSRADGDPWMRSFTRRLCRAMTEAALKRFDPEAPDSPRYASCILADRPAYASAKKSLTVDAYSVGLGNELARMEWTAQ